MYLPSNTPILQDQREAAARHGAESDIRIENVRRTSACGRARLFNTLVAPNAVSDAIGMGTGLNTQILQNQTEISRATGILGTSGQINTGSGPGLGGGPTIQQIIAGAPEVVSLNRGAGCKTPSYAPVPLGPMPTPGMPKRGPTIVQTPVGPMNFRGEDSTAPGAYPSITAPTSLAAAQAYGAANWAPTPPVQGMKYNEILNTGGLTGYAPPWSDAWVMKDAGQTVENDIGVGAWLMDNPWLALAAAGLGVFALSRRNKAGR